MKKSVQIFQILGVSFTILAVISGAIVWAVSSVEAQNYEFKRQQDSLKGIANDLRNSILNQGIINNEL